MKHLKVLSVLFLAGLLSLNAITVLDAQTQDVAYRFSSDALRGTARYQAMGGAFGAVGADYSSVKQNPAGLALYRTSEFQTTILAGVGRDKATWYANSASHSKGLFAGDLSLVMVAPTTPHSQIGISIGMGFSQRQSFQREFDVSSGVESPYSLADYTAYITPSDVSSKDLLDRNAYENVRAPWLSILGHGAGWTTEKSGGIYESSFYYDKGVASPGILGPSNSQLKVRERGGIQDFYVNTSFNFDDYVYFGMGLKLSSMDYKMESYYAEDFVQGDYLELKNVLQTTGLGASINLGVIARLGDNIRAGIALETPSWYKLKDSYIASASSRYSQALDDKGKPLPEEQWTVEDNTPEGAFSSYQLQTPTRVILSLATMGSIGMLSLDYELANYSGIRISDPYGPLSYDNDLMKQYFTPMQSTIRLGGELRIGKQFSLRGGGFWRQAPMRESFDSDTNHGAMIPVNSAGTVPHYEIVGDSFGVTGGIGYRIIPAVYIDLAAVYQGQRGHMYPFPTYYEAGKQVIETPNPIRLMKSQMYGVVTVGYRF